MVATIILVILLAVAPVVVDSTIGDSIGPESVVFPVEKLGENMKIAIKAESHASLVNERIK